MATPSYKHLLALLEEQQARIDRLEAATAGATPEPGSQRRTRRGMVQTAAAGALLLEPATASVSAPASFTSTSATRR